MGCEDDRKHEGQHAYNYEHEMEHEDEPDHELEFEYDHEEEYEHENEHEDNLEHVYVDKLRPSNRQPLDCFTRACAHNFATPPDNGNDQENERNDHKHGCASVCERRHARPLY